MRLAVAATICLISGCASAPSPPAPAYWISDPHYWDGVTGNVHKAMASAALAGRDPAQTYQSLMSIACAQRQRIAVPAEKAEADADCAAVAAMPTSTAVTTTCGQNYDGSTTCEMR